MERGEKLNWNKVKLQVEKRNRKKKIAGLKRKLKLSKRRIASGEEEEREVKIGTEKL